MQEVTGAEMLSAAPGGAAEETLIGETIWGAIRTLREQGWSKKAIARELALDIKTARSWLRRSSAPQRRRPPGRELDRYAEFLRRRAPEVEFNAVVLHREFAGMGYRGYYATVAGYVSAWRASWRGEEQATVRFETDPGEQARVDWLGVAR